MMRTDPNPRDALPARRFERARSAARRAFARIGQAVVLVRQTAKDSRDDRVLGLSAQIAFFALLSIPSLLLVLAGAAGYVGGLLGADVQQSLQERIVSGLGSFLSPETMRDFVGPAVEDLFADGRPDLLSVGAVFALWSVSRMVKVLIEAANVCYDLEEWRSTWRRRLLAVGLSVAGILILAVVLPVIVAGPRLGDTLASRFGLPGIVGDAWRVLYWPFAVVTGVGLLVSFYHFAPNHRTPWRRDVPGALLAAAAWIVAAYGLRVYVRIAISEPAIGPLAGPMILMLWLYVSGLAVLLGAELNGEIERKWPTSPPPQKAVGSPRAAHASGEERLAS